MFIINEDNFRMKVPDWIKHSQSSEEMKTVDLKREDIEGDYGVIKTPTVEDIERRNRPQKYKDTEEAMNETLDDILGD